MGSAPEVEVPAVNQQQLALEEAQKKRLEEERKLAQRRADEVAAVQKAQMGSALSSQTASEAAAGGYGRSLLGQ